MIASTYCMKDFELVTAGSSVKQGNGKRVQSMNQPVESIKANLCRSRSSQRKLFKVPRQNTAMEMPLIQANSGYIVDGDVIVMGKFRNKNRLVLKWQ